MDHDSNSSGHTKNKDLILTGDVGVPNTNHEPARLASETFLNSLNQSFSTL
jgi:hypothetical protein